MRFEIKGEPLPVVLVYLDANEKVNCQKGAMSWMTPNMKMETSTGGFGKAMSKMFSGESIFTNTYTSEGGPGMIAFASSIPGSILPFDISQGEMIVQKGGYLASEPGVEFSVAFQKKFSTAMFGGEGFIMQRLSGKGMAFVEIDGYVVEYELQAGQQMLIDTGYLAAMSSTVTMEIEKVKGVGNVLFGGEGLFNTKVTGPGKIYLQTMPANNLAGALQKYIVTSS
ncbi:MAG: TIGR00266 family protein [Oscillospiraceae bacterium]|nr:TIGR00266 family protein [Oscillospiraceae bacterium]MCH5207314.1 TIGR00266 family protein [Oscillospiraceae bacterium]